MRSASQYLAKIPKLRLLLPERLGRLLHLRRMGAAVRYIMPQRRSQFLAVVGEDCRVLCAARDGNVGHAVVEQVLRRIHGAGWEVERGVAKGA